MRGPNVCACGRGKYADMDCCETCFNKGAQYDERRQDPTRCACGAGKVFDATMCDGCLSRQSAYDDGRG